MEQKPNNNSDTSSADLNHSPSAEKPNKDSGGGASTASSGGARSYECTFCKRGFTNAQALGGHMNIHRKDKAKAKATTPKTHHDFPLIQTFQSKESFNDLMSNGNPVFGAHDKNYHHLYFPPSDRVIQTGTTFQYHDYFPVWRPDQLQDNLSLRIGLSCPPVQDHDHEVVEDHIDLELRLGQYP